MKYLKKKQIKLNKDNYYVVIDFDRTLTAGNSADSWAASGNQLGKQFLEKMDFLYQEYRPIELDYQITFEEKNKAMETWYQECMDLYYEYHLTEERLNKSIQASDLIFRKGAKEFLNQMKQDKVPVIILSAGIGNVIEQFLKENNCYYENILIISNFIEFDEKKNMLPFHSQMIHTLNKTTIGHVPKYSEEKLKKRPYRLLIGDTVEDKKMVEEKEWQQTILVGFLNEKIEENLEVYQKNFDIVLTNEDATFETVKKMVF